MDTACCWTSFEDDFIWLHGKSEGGLRAEGGRKGDDDKWRCQLAAAIYSLWREGQATSRWGQQRLSGTMDAKSLLLGTKTR